MNKAAGLFLIGLATAGCASAPWYRVNPPVPASPAPQADATARREPAGVTVVASFDRAWEDWLLFRITVVNRSDTVVVVDPEDFAAALAATIRDVPPDSAFGLRPAEPEALHDRLDERATGEVPGDGIVEFPGVVEGVADRVADLAGSGPPREGPGRGANAPDGAERNGLPLESLADVGAYLASNLLRPVRLGPWTSAGGLIALPALPLRHALARRRPHPVRSGITTMRAMSSDCALVLRMPAGFAPRRAVFAVHPQ